MKIPMAFIRFSTPLPSGKTSNLYVYETYCECGKDGGCACGKDDRYLQFDFIMDVDGKKIIKSAWCTLEEAEEFAKKLLSINDAERE